MVATGFQRGHKIYYNEYKKEWRYVSDDAPAKIEKMCRRCLQNPLKDGEDYCIGHMEGVRSACCGHGVEKGFIILNDGRRFEEVTYDRVKEGYEHHLSELQGQNEILTKENKQLRQKVQRYEESRTQLKFGKFRQKLCDLLWECGYDNISLNDKTNAKQIFNNAHYICNKLLEEYNISEK